MAANSRALALRAKGFLDTRGKRESERLIGRRNVQKVRARKRILTASRSWQRWEVAMIGRLPDSVVARRIGRTYVSVAKKRYSLGIACNPLVKPWTVQQLALLGKIPDREIGRRFGRKYKTVHQMRRKLGIPMARLFFTNGVSPRTAFWGVIRTGQ